MAIHIRYADAVDPDYHYYDRAHSKCIYCGSEMVCETIDKLTDYSFDDFKKSFNNKDIVLMEFEPPGEEEYLAEVDPYDSLDDDYFKFPRGNFGYDETCLSRCLSCGWWSVTEEYTAVKYNLWQVFFGIDGAIKVFDITDVSTPVNEIRAHLVRKYDDRFYINPRVFEDTVSSVFGDLGYKSVCTTYSNDGGIDVVLSGKGSPIAVQVKRTKNKIEVEQIRAFLGALIINNHTNGIYVSTSDYRAGCNKIADRHIIELVNGQRFYDTLKEAQIIRNTPSPLIDFKPNDKFYFTGAYPLNSM